MITIKINEKEHRLPETNSLQEFLEQLPIVQNGIAIAINQNIIPKDKWPTTTLADNDNILIIKATQGG